MAKFRENRRISYVMKKSCKVIDTKIKPLSSKTLIFLFTNILKSSNSKMSM